MRNSRKQCLKAIETCFSVINPLAVKSKDEKYLEAVAALDTMRRMLKSMSDKAFQVHVEAYDEDNSVPAFLKKRKPAYVNRPPLALLAIMLAIGFAALASAQEAQAAAVISVPRSTIECFENARCQTVGMQSVKLKPNEQGLLFPNSIRTEFPASVYTATDGTIPFHVYRSDTYDGAITALVTGQCRNVSTLIPLPSPGFYWVRYFHPKAALLEIEVDSTGAIVRFMASCELHD
jgi:hypothetical protein